MGNHETKMFQYNKENYKMKRQPTKRQKNILSSTYDRGFVSRTYKELNKKLNIKKTNNLVKMGYGIEETILKRIATNGQKTLGECQHPWLLEISRFKQF